MKFVTVNLPKIAAEARNKFEAHKDLLDAYASGEKPYEEFAARVVRRWRGEDEDGPSSNKDEDATQLFDEPPDQP